MRGLGISAVPTFIFDRKLGVSGAHPPIPPKRSRRRCAKP